MSDNANAEIPADLRYDPTPKTYGDLAVPLQLAQLRSLAAKLHIDLETECRRLFRVETHELSEKAADALLKRFRSLLAQKGAAA